MKLRVPSKIVSLVREVRSLVHAARSAAARNINAIQVITNFEIGRRIFEHEQKGADRAEYGNRIHDEAEQNFYEVEAGQNNWSLPELRRQFDAGLYERLALSRDKMGIRKLAKHGQVVKGAKDLFKEPYVLEFLGLDEKSSYSENDLESAIIDKIEHFLLELGKGFLKPIYALQSTNFICQVSRF